MRVRVRAFDGFRLPRFRKGIPFHRTTRRRRDGNPMLVSQKGLSLTTTWMSSAGILLTVQIEES